MKEEKDNSTYSKALIISVFIFLTGLMIGFFVDNLRLSDITTQLSQVDIQSEDSILLGSFLQGLGKDQCNLALDTNLKFNDKIYSEGKTIEDAFRTNLLSPDLKYQWSRYVLLQTQFWFNSIQLKKACNFNYSNVVYISKLQIDDPQEKAMTQAQSDVMTELKNKCDNKIMLIPLTSDSNLSVIDAIVAKYNITRLPAIIINEQNIFQGPTSLNQINSVTNC